MPSSWIQSFRLRLASSQSLLHFAVLGVVAGLACAFIMAGFRLAIEWLPTLWMPNENPEAFESLPRWLHFALPLFGGITLGLVLQNLQPHNLRTGIPHVITHLHAHDGRMPIKNALVQFFGGAFAIITGQSAGREGPAVHLGSAASSVIGQSLLLPNNSIRIMIGCGTAAAIAASFNTPIAGVIFAMEVVMMEYTVAGFTPIVIAAVTATTVTRVLFETDAIFTIPAIQMTTLWELPYITLLGLLVGGCAAMFIIVMKIGLKLSDRPILHRLTLAGFITGCCAALVPEIMGIGYDSLNDVLSGNLGLTLILAIIGTKLVATAMSCGLGMPIGLIGPSLLIGACLGGALGTLGASVFPELASGGSFYVMLGMGAMMGAVLNAPLAALMALLELTQNPNIIFPGMLAITVATLTNSEIFKQRSSHQTVLQHIKQLLPTDPVSLALQRTSVATLIDRNIALPEQTLSAEQAQDLLTKPYQSYILWDQDKQLHLIYRRDVAPQIDEMLQDPTHNSIDLLEITRQSQKVAELHIQATLREAIETMDKHEVDVLYISGYISRAVLDTGILTRDTINQYTHKPQD